MSILVISKKTNFDQYQDIVKKHVDQGFLSEDEWVNLLKEHEEHYVTLDELQKALKQRRISSEKIIRDIVWPKKKFNLVITVGGDGTFLTASQQIKEGKIPIAGIRSSCHSVGQLCSFNKTNIEHLLDQFLSHSLHIIEHTRLRAEVFHVSSNCWKTTRPVLNDFLFANIDPSCTTRYRFHVNDHSEDQKSSGIWIATPTGSTAAIKAAGGKVINNPAEERSQYFVRELYKPPKVKKNLLKKGFFHPEHDRVEIKNSCKHAIIAMDGQHGKVNLNYGDRIRFHSTNSLKVVTLRTEKNALNQTDTL